MSKKVVAASLFAFFAPMLVIAPSATAQQVVDSKGKTVGTVQGEPNRPWVRLKMRDGVYTAVRIGWSGFLSNQGDTPIFVTEKNDCSGTRYLYGSLFNYATTYRLKTGDTKLYLSYPIPPYKMVTVASVAYWDPSMGKLICQALMTPQTTYVASYKTTDTNGLGFTPPFTLQ